MKVQIASDLHLEFPQNFKFVMENWECLGDVLILAGDVCAWPKIDKYFAFLGEFAKQYDVILHIPGNHEYYGMELSDVEDQLFINRKHINCHLINNSKICINKATFICSTLWSQAHPKVENAIGDYTYVNGMTIDAGNKWHKDSVETVDNLLGQVKQGYRIMVTHHLPLWDCVSDYFVGNPINSAFVSDQSNLMEKHKIHYWIHGHSHDYMEKKINGTTFIRNPIGYVHAGESSRVIRPCVIDLK